MVTERGSKMGKRKNSKMVKITLSIYPEIFGDKDTKYESIADLAMNVHEKIMSTCTKFTSMDLGSFLSVLYSEEWDEPIAVDTMPIADITDLFFVTSHNLLGEKIGDLFTIKLSYGTGQMPYMYTDRRSVVIGVTLEEKMRCNNPTGCCMCLSCDGCHWEAYEEYEVEYEDGSFRYEAPF